MAITEIMNNYITHYQSANLSNEKVIRDFVVRKKEFERVITDIRQTDKDSSLQHYIYIGRRGSGKSTLLRRIQAEINTDDKLNKRFIVTNLSEEQAGIYKIYDLWDYVIRDLQANEHPIENLNYEDFQDDLKVFTKELFFNIHRYLKKTNKQLILLIDNIDRIFKNIGKDASLFRELLMNYNDIRIIGGSTIMSEQYWKYNKPFYEFFSLKRLNPLTNEEVKLLLKHWSIEKDCKDINAFIINHPGKLQAIRMLTDGTPRTMLLFVDLLINRPMQYGFEYLKRIIDEATPIYQERLAMLSPQQQKIVLELSFFWEAAPIEDLISVCKMPGKVISSQLNALVKSGIVEKIKGPSKNMLYRLEERFFNMWLLMTQGGPKQKKEVKYLTIFLEHWYDKEELKVIYTDFIDELDKGVLKPDYAINMTKALAHSRYITIKDRDQIIEKVLSINELKHEWMDQLPELARNLITNAIDKYENGKYNEAIEIINSIEQDSEFKYFFLGVLYINLVNFEEAEKYLLTGSELGDASSMFLLGSVKLHNKKRNEGMEYLSKAIKLEHAGAMNYMAELFIKEGKLKDAKDLLYKAMNKGNEQAIINLAKLHDRQGNFKEAEEFYLLAEEKGTLEKFTDVVSLYFKNRKLKKAEEYSQKAIKNNEPTGKFGLALLYYHQNKNKKKALQLMESVPVERRNNAAFNVLKNVFHLWTGNIEDYEKERENLFDQIIEHRPALEYYIIELLVHKQYNYIFKQFTEGKNSNELKKLVIPLYYLVLGFLKNKDAELLKMPPEISENVSDMMKEIMARQKLYEKNSNSA